MSVVLKPDLEIVPGYRLVRPLGQGAAGAVWVARASGGVCVAIKVVSDLESVLSERELRAIRVVHQVKHPHLCPIFGVWFLNQQGTPLSPAETDSILGGQVEKLTDTIRVGEVQAKRQSESQAFHMVIAMGLGDGTLLDRLHQVNGINQDSSNTQADSSDSTPQVFSGIDPDELMGYFSAAASAIDELNLKHNIYHCDLKPQNILLVGGHAQVCDFGLARQVDDIRKTSIAMGTPAYGAPEMLFERSYSKTLDQYSLAMTYYHLRTGKLPFQSLSQSAIFQAKMTGELDLSELSGEELQVVHKATQLNPDHRYPTCQAFVKALQSALDPTVNLGGSSARKPNLLAQRSTQSVLAGLGLGLGIVIFVAAMLSMGGDGSEVDDHASSVPVPVQVTTDDDRSDPELAASRKPVPELLSAAVPLPAVPDNPAHDADSRSPVVSTVKPTAKMPVPKEPVPEDPKPEKSKAPITLKQRMANETSLQHKLDLLIAAGKSDALCTAISDQPLVDMILKEVESRLLSPGVLNSGKLASADIRVARQTDEIYRLVDRCDDELPGNSMARLALVSLASDLILIRQGGDKHGGIDPSRVRSLLVADQYDDPNQAANAALIVAATWTAKFKESDWKIELAEQDILRAQQLAGTDSKNKAVLNRVLQTYLQALLMRRHDAQLHNTTDPMIAPKIVRVAESLRHEPASAKMARASLWLVSQQDDVDPVDWMEADFASETPEFLESTLQMGAAFSQLRRGSKRRAVEVFNELLANDPTGKRIPANDRHRAAKELLAWIIQQSGVSDQETRTLRYADDPAAYQPAIHLIDQFSHDDIGTQNDLSVERLIWFVAAKEWDQAVAELEKREANEIENREAMPQLARAVFDLSILKVSTGPSQDRGQWFSRLIATTLAQPITDPNDMFIRCYKPVVAQVKPTDWAGPNRNARPLNDVSDASVIQFGRQFLSLASQAENQRQYPSIESCHSDIEFVAQLAGFRSAEPEERANFYCQAIAAFLRQKNERQSDVLPTVVMSRHQTYASEARQRGRSAYQNFMDAMVAYQRASVATDQKTVIDARKEVIRRTNLFLEQTDIAASADLKSIATNYLAAATMEQAIFDPAINDRSTKQIMLARALWDARSVAEQEEASVAKEEGLAMLSKIACRAAIDGVNDEASERYKLVDEALKSIDIAIELRKANSMDYTNLAIERLYAHWVDTLISAGSPRFDQAKRAAKYWISQISADSKTRLPELSLRADSVTLQCDWHFKVGVTLHQCGERVAAEKHLAKSFTIATLQLDSSHPIRHLVTLAMVSLTSEELARTKDRQLYQELKNALDRISDLSPPVAKKRDHAMKQLQRIMSSGR